MGAGVPTVADAGQRRQPCLTMSSEAAEDAGGRVPGHRSGGRFRRGLVVGSILSAAIVAVLVSIVLLRTPPLRGSTPPRSSPPTVSTGVGRRPTLFQAEGTIPAPATLMSGPPRVPPPCAARRHPVPRPRPYPRWSAGGLRCSRRR